VKRWDKCVSKVKQFSLEPNLRYTLAGMPLEAKHLVFKKAHPVKHKISQPLCGLTEKGGNCNALQFEAT